MDCERGPMENSAEYNDKSGCTVNAKEVKQEVEVSREARLLTIRLKNRRAARFSLAGIRRVAPFVAILFLTASAATNLFAATYRTPNFVVSAGSDAFARQAGEAAEKYRRDLAFFWFGEVLPPWSNPCLVTIETGPNLSAKGETVFKCSNNEVYDWKMTAQGTEERVLDSVLPHEVMHAILASYLRGQAPRWLDEGMATAVESDCERANYRYMLADFLHARKGIAFNDMVAMTEYPDDYMPFYAQSFSVCEYLILIGGPRRLAEFAKECARTGDWNATLGRYYEGRSLGDLQLEWVAWVGEWDAAKRPKQLPKTPKLRDFDEWRREELLASRGAAPERTRNALEPTARAQQAEEVASPSNWRTTLGETFDGVRSWGRGSEKTKNSESLTANAREERFETTSAEARGDRSREFGEVRQIAPIQQGAQTARNTSNGGASPAPVWIPRANVSAAKSSDGRSTAARTGVLTSGAGSASRTY